MTSRGASLKSLSLVLVVLSAFPTLVSSKFTYTYPGIATDGLNACLADATYNFTRLTISYRENAGHGFTCIMANIPNDRQTILSAGASILGLIPTAITLLGNKRLEINLIHGAFPLLAFFLSLTGVSVDSRIPWHNTSDPKLNRPKSSSLGQTKWPLNLIWHPSKSVSPSTTRSLLAVHVLAFLIATVVTWQSYALSLRAVVSWSCWTSFLPMIWFLLGPLIHLGEISVLRINHKSHPHWCRGLMLVLDTFNKVQFLAGTAILGSLALVTGHNAVKVLAVYGGAAIVMRECAAWVLETLNPTNP